MTVTEHYYRELSSTMDRAREIAARSNQEDDLFRVRAAHQWAGRGRRGHRWFDLPDNAIMMTMAIRRGGSHDPRDPNPGTLALRAGAGLLTGIHDLLSPKERPRVQIKWPNDLLLDERKLAGILVEADPRWFYVGIGINTFPPGTRENELFTTGARSGGGEYSTIFESASGPAVAPAPASLRELPEISDDSIFLRHFDGAFTAALQGNDWRDIVTRYLAWRGEIVTIVDRGGNASGRLPGVSGVLAGVSEDGSVRLLREGAETICYAGTLRRHR